MTAELRNELKGFFKSEFADSILKKLNTGYPISCFSINPLVLIALSSGIYGEVTSKNMAKALLYPRVLGTSISTTFGDKMQKLCISLLGANASAVPGMDIEFTDKTTNKKILCQLKSGPNTINSGDVAPIIKDMTSAFRLLQQNRVGANMPEFAVAVTYGSDEELNAHYKKIKTYNIGAQMDVPIYIGKDFWFRLTGEENFYSDLISIFIELFDSENYSQIFESDLNTLAEEIEEKYFVSGVFDPEKI